MYLLMLNIYSIRYFFAILLNKTTNPQGLFYYCYIHKSDIPTYPVSVRICYPLKFDIWMDISGRKGSYDTSLISAYLMVHLWSKSEVVYEYHAEI